jgi:uncharacterized membrane protein
VFWFAFALGAMVFLNRKVDRSFGYAGRVAVVVVKLFIIDFSKIGIERIVSFYVKRLLS